MKPGTRAGPGQLLSGKRSGAGAGKTCKTRRGGHFLAHVCGGLRSARTDDGDGKRHPDQRFELYIDSHSDQTWHGESDYSFDDENELCFVITRAWIRGSLRKIGIRALRKALKEEGC
jgi:hypothetical protein